MTWGHFILTFLAGCLFILAAINGPTWWGVFFLGLFGADALALVWFTDYEAKHSK